MYINILLSQQVLTHNIPFVELHIVQHFLTMKLYFLIKVDPH